MDERTAGESTAIFGDALYDPDGRQTTRPAVVLVHGGRVTAAGAREEGRVPAHATPLDAERLTLLPGLIHCHVHLCFLGEGIDLGERLSTPSSLVVLQAVASCRKTL